MSTRNGVKKLRFKRCPKAEWKEYPSYTCYYGKDEVGSMYFFQGENEPVFEFVQRGFDATIFDLKDMKKFLNIWPEIVQKMVEFQEEVVSED